MTISRGDHERAVKEFLKDCREKDPEAFKSVCEKYPTITSRQSRNMKRLEQNVGLLGLQPANLPDYIAFELGYESIYTKELQDEGE